MVINTKKQIKNVSARSYLIKDRDAFLADLVSYAKTFYPDQINDFSEAGIGGLFMDMAASVGDNLSFYLDHQFHELSVDTAVESKNIQRHIRNAGVKITGNSPAVVDVTFALIVSAVKNGTRYVPTESELPIILEGTIVTANNGIKFELTEELDFNSKDKAGNFIAKIIINDVDSNGAPETFILQMTAVCVSGTRVVESFGIENIHIPFRTITLSNENITDVVSVVDTEGNKYYEVDSLTQDTVFIGILNTNEDGDLVKENLEIIPAPYRFTKSVNIVTKLTTLQFGSGDANSLDDDVIPDPSEFAIPLYGKKNFSRFTIDPGNLLQTRTLGISPVNTSISVDYRHGGGLLHNVSVGSVRFLDKLLIKFPGNPSSATATTIRASIDVNNFTRASGGENAPTLSELKEKVPSYRNAQSRIVTKEDLLARVYTMPSNFGRVFKAGVRSNPLNPLATQLFIISRDADGNLVVSPDALKKNLRVFLNQFRMISDAIDILDARVINISIEFKVALQPSATKNVVLQDIISRLQRYFAIENFQIDQPIQLDDVNNIIFNSPGVMSVLDIRAKNMFGTVLERSYSGSKFDVASNIKKRLVIGPPGSIFEIKYPQFDIIGTAI